MAASVDYGDLEYTQPTSRIKGFNMEPVPQRIFDGMKKYEESNRGFGFVCFERQLEGDDGAGHAIVSHRPEDSQISEFWRLNLASPDTPLERISYFDLGSGRTVDSFSPVSGDDWRGVWRAGGAILAMDLDGSEYAQLWRYWEDSRSSTVLPHIDSELENKPGGRFERLTHDNRRYNNVRISESNKIMAFISNKENGTDMLVYTTELVNSQTGAAADSKPFTLPARLVTPPSDKENSRWLISDISVDDQYLLLSKSFTSSHSEGYIVPVSGGAPERILLPNATEKEEETVYLQRFSRDPATPHRIYLISSAYGDFESVVAFDRSTGTVLHITTPEPNLKAPRPVNWSCEGLIVTSEYVYFRANAGGYTKLFVLPLSGPEKDTVLEIKLKDWEGGMFTYSVNHRNGRPHEIVLALISHLSSTSLAHLDIKDHLDDVKVDENGGAYISVPLDRYKQATPIPPSYRTFPPKLLTFSSFDGLEVPCMYYHPNNGQSAVPVVISIHGGPASQSKSNTRAHIHWYIMNELGYAIIYPNVRGSSGYGKHYMALDDVEKREDSVKDIGTLLDHIEKSMKNGLDSSRIAVIGGSYGGYMTLASLIHFPTKFACGLANFPIAHWPSFLEKTAPLRQAHRRGEYGDERKPEIREYLEKISPLNRTSEIKVPLQIAHGDCDSRVPVDQAIRMWQTVLKTGIHSELMVCEKEGHGFKQRSVIEYTNAAKLHFLERYLPVTSPRSPL
ncbi:Alpha/Beta hydrolase protein [Favolaschia claudopus]|uniref:Dipeptidyl-peptidase V n=1 Tax=Favolaschia claudopus TaxID=2862362 RepID=A0AAW0CBU0_9AGAR